MDREAEIEVRGDEASRGMHAGEAADGSVPRDVTAGDEPVDAEDEGYDLAHDEGRDGDVADGQ